MEPAVAVSSTLGEDLVRSSDGLVNPAHLGGWPSWTDDLKTHDARCSGSYIAVYPFQTRQGG